MGCVFVLLSLFSSCGMIVVWGWVRMWVVVADCIRGVCDYLFDFGCDVDLGWNANIRVMFILHCVFGTTVLVWFWFLFY